MAIQPSDYFLQALESQRAINTHIHEIEPTTPIFLFEIDLNEIKPGTANDYGLIQGPIKDGVIRIHNDFNLFKVNRGIIKWKGNYYYPFPVYGEQFDVTSNGTIPTPKVKFSSQFLDDEYNSFYKYIRMQINDLKDVVGAKVTRRKTFIRYLSPDNFEGDVNPFNNFTDTPWATRDGDTLTIRSLKNVPLTFSKWIVYYLRPNYNNSKIFTSFKTDDRSKTLDSNIQKQNYFINSLDFCQLHIDESINLSTDIQDVFTADVLMISGSNANYSSIIHVDSNEFRNSSNNKVKILCSHKNISSFNGASTETISYPLTFSEPSVSLTSFISFQSLVEGEGYNGIYSIDTQNQNDLTIKLSKPISTSLNINYLTIPTGIYTGINPFTQDDIKLSVQKIYKDFGSNSSGEFSISFNTTFDYTPKFIYNASYTNFDPDNNNFYIKDISSTGCTFVAHTLNNTSLNEYNINLLATDYMMDEETPTGNAQIFSSNFAGLKASFDEHRERIDKVKPEIFEVELSPDIFYIDRKVQEDSMNVVYELASLLDIEGIKLPGRLLLSKNCPLTYRGEGCCYERKNRITYAHSGVYGEVAGSFYPLDSANNLPIHSIRADQRTLGLRTAPPVATETDEIIVPSDRGDFIDKGRWGRGIEYKQNNFVVVEKNGIFYYFVAKVNHTSSAVNSPPNVNFWIADICSKTLKGCRLRWKENPNFSEITVAGVYEYSGYSMQTNGIQIKQDEIIAYKTASPLDRENRQLIGILPFGGFPSVEGKYQSQQGPQSSS